MFSKPQSEIMQHWGDNKIPLVSICCTTYNHENYIEQAIKGFLIQETTFPFEILIRDDCSNDNTASIIKKYQKLYPKLIFPVYEKENQYPKGVKPMPVLYKKAKGEFIALCEGDDYWIDPRKLEKQVGFLIKNIDYTFCGTKYNVVSAVAKTLSNPGSYSLNDILLGNQYGTLTVLFYRKYLTREFYLFINTMPVGDWPLWIFLSIHGKGKVLDFISANYRVHSGGTYSSKTKISQKILVLDILSKLKYSIIKENLNNEVMRKSWRINFYRLLKTKPNKSESIKVLNKRSSLLFFSKKEKFFLSLMIKKNLFNIVVLYGFLIKLN